jgi:hypothetical protein
MEAEYTIFEILGGPHTILNINTKKKEYWSANKFLARPASRCILYYGENISFDDSLVLYIYIYIYIYIYNTNIPLIMTINRIYETQNLLSL